MNNINTKEEYIEESAEEPTFEEKCMPLLALIVSLFIGFLIGLFFIFYIYIPYFY